VGVASRLYTTFLVIFYVPFILVLTVCITISIWHGIRVLLQHWPSRVKANKILSLPTSKFQAFEVSHLERNQANKEEDNMKGFSIGGDEP